MPIIDPPPDPSVPLSQGDILKDVTLFVTKRTWSGGGEARWSEKVLCLVLSRPCVAVRDEWVVVAAIDQYKKPAPSQFESYDEAKQFFTEIRDGLTTPDQFYLGQIEGREGSFCARFDALHTIQIPKESAERQTFITASRIGRLHKDFAHDLHLRLFRAFASLGFDDHGWFSDRDLQAFLAVADRDKGAIEQELRGVEAKLKVGDSQGFTHPSEKEKHERDKAKLEKKLQGLEKGIAPYREQVEKRKKPAAPQSEGTSS